MKPEEVEWELGKRLNDGIRVRNRARYESHAEIREEEAGEILNLARTLVAQLSRKLTENT